MAYPNRVSCCVGWVRALRHSNPAGKGAATLVRCGLIVGLPVTLFLGEIWGFVVFGILWLALGVRALVEKERTASSTLARKLNSVPTATVKDQAHSFVAGLLWSRDFTRHVSAPEVRY